VNSQPRPEPPLTVVALTSWLWRLSTPIVSLYAVRQGSAFNLIDTGTAGGERPILECLAAIDGTPAVDVHVEEILLTHGHDDHTGSAAALAALTGARVLAPAPDTAVIEGRQTQAPPELADWEVPLFEQVSPLVPPAPPVQVDRRLEDGDVLDWERPATVVTAPGHTPGSVAVLFAAERTLVAGDTVASHEGRAMLGVFNSDPARARESLRRLAGLDVERACFGHGDPLPAGARADLQRVAAGL
jgi:glyoxylase-like metal-dependent hydrolase (beta-lactamase superfamily II)